MLMANSDVRMKILTFIYNKRPYTLVSKQYYEDIYRSSLQECGYYVSKFDVEEKQKYICKSIENNPLTVNHSLFNTKYNIMYTMKLNIDNIKYIFNPSPSVQLYYYNNKEDKDLTLIKNKSKELMNVMIENNDSIDKKDICKLTDLQKRKALRTKTISTSDLTSEPTFLDSLATKNTHNIYFDILCVILEYGFYLFIVYNHFKGKISFLDSLNLIYTINLTKLFLSKIIWDCMCQILDIFDKLSNSIYNFVIKAKPLNMVI